MVGHQWHKYCGTLLMGTVKKKPPYNPVNGRATTAQKCRTLLMGMAKKKPLQNPVNGRATKAQKINKK